MKIKNTILTALALVTSAALGQVATPIHWRMRDCTGSDLNRLITVTPLDGILGFYNTAIVAQVEFTVQPVGGAADTNLVTGNYRFTYAGLTKAQQVFWPGDPTITNAADTRIQSPGGLISVFTTTNGPGITTNAVLVLATNAARGVALTNKQSSAVTFLGGFTNAGPAVLTDAGHTFEEVPSGASGLLSLTRDGGGAAYFSANRVYGNHYGSGDNLTNASGNAALFTVGNGAGLTNGSGYSPLFKDAQTNLFVYDAVNGLEADFNARILYALSGGVETPAVDWGSGFLKSPPAASTPINLSWHTMQLWGPWIATNLTATGTFIGNVIVQNQGIGTNTTIMATNATGVAVTNITTYAPADCPQLNLFAGTNSAQINVSPTAATAGQPLVTGDSYFSIRVDPTHNGNPTHSVGNSETTLAANQFAFQGKHFQFGVESDFTGSGYYPYIYLNAITTVSAAAPTNASVPLFFTINGWVNNARQVHALPIYGHYETTNAPYGTFKLALGHDSDRGFYNGNSNPDMIGMGTNDAIRIWGGKTNWVEHLTTAQFDKGIHVGGVTTEGVFSAYASDPTLPDMTINANGLTHTIEIGSTGNFGTDLIVHSSGAYNQEHFHAGPGGNYIVNGGLAVGYRGPASDFGSVSLYNSGTFTNHGLVIVDGGIGSTSTTRYTLATSGYTNATTRNIRIMGVTGTSIIQSNSASATQFSRGTITTPTDIILQQKESISGSSIAAQGMQDF